ncbi:MAG: hypothetical protein ACE365_07065 [Gammaproteobacteria bacterium]
MKKASIEKMNWQTARKLVHKVNPEFAEAVDRVDPPSDFVLWKVRYPFGAHILKDGELHLPMPDGSLAGMHSGDLPKELSNSLGYTPDMPVGVVLKNSMELYVEVVDNVIPWRIMYPGKVFSLWGMLQKPGTSAFTGKLWQMTAGARSLMFLSKISQSKEFRRVKKTFGLKSAIPTKLLDQWPFLVDLANSPVFDQDWNLEVLYFSGQWLDKWKNFEWESLENYLIRLVWKDSSFLRDQIVFNFSFSMALMEKNLRPNPYLADTVKHLYLIGRGVFPGFRVAVDDVAGPVTQFQKVFNDVYHLKFAPTMIHPGYIQDVFPRGALYYSLEIPTLMEFSPRSKWNTNKISDLREIKHIQTVTTNFFLEDKLGLNLTPIYNSMRDTLYQYFHTDHDELEEILTIENVMDSDRLIKSDEKRFSKPLCITSAFLRGCVQIASAKD